MRRRAAWLLALLAGGAGPLAAQSLVGVLDAGVVVEGNVGGVSQAMFDVAVAFDPDSPPPIVVNLTTVDGSATTTDGDYVPQTAIELIFSSDGVQTVLVDVVGDDKVEPDETFRLAITAVSPGVAIVPGQESGEATIQNDDLPTLSIGDATVVEGDAGATVGAVFEVTLSSPSPLPVTVDFATSDGTATAGGGDYQPASGTLTFATAGALTFGTGEVSLDVVVTVQGDLEVEGDETFFVVLGNATGALIVDGSGQGTIVDDDSASLSIGDLTVDEGNSGERRAVLPVSLSAASALPVTVDFTTRDGTATAAGGDYRVRTGRLTFAAGVVLQGVEVPVIGDREVEGDERLTVELRNPVGATLADAEGVLTIRNDDRAPGSIRLVGPPDVAEGGVMAFVVAERTGGADGAASVDFLTADGTARAGADYTRTAGTLSWGDGEAGTRSFELSILDDNLREGDETVVVRLLDPVGASLGTPARLELTIVDDDLPARLEPVGETQRAARPGGQLELAVVARREDGSPVAGAEVLWEVEGDAELVSGSPTTTDAQGGASQQVALGTSLGTVRVVARIAATEQVVTFEIALESGLDELFDPLRDPAESSLAAALDAACRTAGAGFAELCDYLFGLDPAEQRQLISELAPREAGALADLLLQSPYAQLLNLRRHLAARRGGSTARLALGITGESVPLEALRQAFAGEVEVLQRMAARIDAAIFQREEEPPAASPPEIDSPSRLGFFASGRVDVGDRPGSAREAGFELDTLGLTVGLDYQVSPRLVVGGALGYVDTDTRVDRDGGGIDARGYSLSAFATWFGDRFWLDGILGYGRTEYDFVRNIDLPRPFAGQRRLAARGRPEGRQLAVDLGAGYDASFGATSLSGFGRLSYIEAAVDGFTERGAGPFGLALRRQRIDSLLAEAGVELVYASSRPWGVLQPVLRASALHEFADDSRLVLASFSGDAGSNLFELPTDPPDRDYFRVAAGLTATLARGRGLYLLYEIDLARQDLDLYRLTAGLRLEL